VVGLESDGRGSESRFVAYVETLTTALGHADRAVAIVLHRLIASQPSEEC